MKVSRYWLLSVVCTLVLHGENLIRVDSGGQFFIIDADSETVRKNLKAADPEAGENHLPAWLYPYRGAVPRRAHYDVRTGIAEAHFSAGGTVDEVVAYYGQLFRSRGYASGAPMSSATARIVSGKHASGSVSAIVSVFRGDMNIQVTFAPSRARSGKKHFKAAWYDDNRGLLCLEETNTGAQYYLDRGGILEANLNRPGAVKSQASAMPAWLPVYPGAQPKQEQMAFHPNITLVTRDPMRAVYEWYVRVAENAGATVVDRGLMRSGTPPEDFSAHLTALRGDDKVEIRIGKVFQPLAIGVPPTAEDQIAIGIRYPVPLR